MNDATPKTNRFRLTVAYDGTAYHGWQIQPGVPTIEGELNRALTDLLGEKIAVIGASRTDSGVHALGNIAVFDAKTRIPAEKIAYAVNRRLPDDICVQKSEAVGADFHPRHRESRKTYEYRIWNADFPLPAKRLSHYFTYRPLDPEKMQEAADYLVGEHDFISFCAAGAAPLLEKASDAATLPKEPDDMAAFNRAKSTVRTIYSANVRCNRPAEIIITLTGNGFLYNMVRIIAGTLIEVGYGRFSPAFVNEILAAKDRSKAGPTAPPQGLTLIKYEFPA